MYSIHSSVYPTQKVFRVLVDAMSHPGRVYRMPKPQKIDPWETSLLAIVYTLLDHEVSFAFIGQKITIAEQIYAATKARQVAIEEADYIIVEGNRSDGQILSAKCGVGAYPEQGATIIYVIDQETHNGNSAGLNEIILNGPGIKDQTSPQLAGLSVEEFQHIRDLNTEYPLGVDCVFLGEDNQVMCIPRSTKITVRNGVME